MWFRDRNKGMHLNGIKSINTQFSLNNIVFVNCAATKTKQNKKTLFKIQFTVKFKCAGV